MTRRLIMHLGLCPLTLKCGSEGWLWTTQWNHEDQCKTGNWRALDYNIHFLVLEDHQAEAGMNCQDDMGFGEE